MEKIVLDTNVLFRSLRSNNSRIRQILFRNDFDFYAPNFLITEIFKHKHRIVKASEGSEDVVYELLDKVLQRINFINEEAIGTVDIIHAHRLCSVIDEKDTMFVALTLHLSAKFWTFDKKLIQGLQRKGFVDFFDPLQ